MADIYIRPQGLCFSTIVTSRDESSLARSECLPPPSTYRNSPAVSSRTSFANAKFDLTFQALHGNVAWHFMRRKFIAGKQYDPNHFEIIGFDNRMRNCRCNRVVQGSHVDDFTRCCMRNGHYSDLLKE